MSWITDLFSGGVKGVGDAISEVLGKVIADPTQRQQLSEEIQSKIIDSQNLTIQMAEQKYEATLKDIQSSRDMQVAALKQESWLAKNFVHILASFVTIGFFGLLIYMCKYDVPKDNKDMLNIMLGSLGTAWVGVMGWYYGSSMQSKAKDETISKLSN